MATLVKQRRKEKPKAKEKKVKDKDEIQRKLHELQQENDTKESTIKSPLENADMDSLPSGSREDSTEPTQANMESMQCETKVEDVIKTIDKSYIEHNTLKYLDNIEPGISKTQSSAVEEKVSVKQDIKNELQPEQTMKTELVVHNTVLEHSVKLDMNSTDLKPETLYKELNEKLKRMQIPLQVSQESCNNTFLMEESMKPSAPQLAEPECINSVDTASKDEVCETKISRIPCLTLDEAVQIFGGREIAGVKAISENVEALIEGESISTFRGHPLEDLLSTFRSSLSALDKERVSINCGYSEEQKRRSLLWKVEKKSINLSEKCPCGANIDLRVVYDYAELQKDKLPAAKMRLKGLLNDVQDSYCYHQYCALWTYYQIDEFILETTTTKNRNKLSIQAALSLILKALRLSDGAPKLFPQALERWATILADKLIDYTDIYHLLYVIHHLFRQSRSVQWAGRVIRARVSDSSSAARLIAIIDVLLNGATVDTAKECTEEAEAWEEVDLTGGGAVGEGRLRERDLIMLLNCLPLQDMVANIVLCKDIKNPRIEKWGDTSGGHGVVKACCGARALLSVLRRGMRARSYVRLRECVRALAASVLRALASLHMHSRDTYAKELQERITTELEASFEEGVCVMGEEIHRLPATLLTDHTAEMYYKYLENLHGNSPQSIESLNVELPALKCDQRVKVISQLLTDRQTDYRLATTGLKFLIQTGVRKGSKKCSCDVAALEHISKVLDVHTYLYASVYNVFADIIQGETIDKGLVKYLNVSKWRPSPQQMQEVLSVWQVKCPQLVQHLLYEMDYTPHSGVSLDTQCHIGWWVSQLPETPEWVWGLLQQLRVHRSHWGLPLEAPSLDTPPVALPEVMFAILATDLGHCLPLVCGPGIDALHRLCTSRPAEGIHCLGRLVTVMAQSPESISLTPRFSEVVSIILNWGPNLVQRALGRRSLTGVDLLQNLLIQQLGETHSVDARRALLRAWLHVLWTPSVPGSSRGVVDAAVRATGDLNVLDDYVSYVLQEENSKRFIDDAVRFVSSAPLLCQSALRGLHHRELSMAYYGRILDVLANQREKKQKIHVDNAIKQVGAPICSEDLSIYRTANALLNTSNSHPAHLMLWMLFLQMYLERPPSTPNQSAPPVSPLFFSGLVKSRTLTQLKARLQETITYHHDSIETQKKQIIDSPNTSNITIESNPTSESMFPELSITEIYEDLSDPSCDSSSDSEDKSSSHVETNNKALTMAFHTGAELALRKYHSWLQAGDRVQASPHEADIRHVMSHEIISASLSASLPAIVPSSPQIHKNVTETPCTYFEEGIKAIHAVKDESNRNWRQLKIKPLFNDNVFNYDHDVLKLVDKNLTEIERFAREWSTEVNRILQLDAQLWELTGKLRVRKPLPPVKKSCPQSCKPITIRIAEDEWCISTAVEREILENRCAYNASVRRLCRARPHFARTAAILLTLPGYVFQYRRLKRFSDIEINVCERVWRCFRLAHACSLARQLLETVITDVSERSIVHNPDRCVELLSKWSRGDSNQQLLCGALVAPNRIPEDQWAKIYIAVCKTKLPPQATFSYLSKFDMARWSHNVDRKQRQQVLEVIVDTALRCGAKPDEESQVLIELLGVHAHAIVTHTELHWLVCAVNAHAATNALAPRLYEHLERAVAERAQMLTLDEIGHLLREIGQIWWKARENYTSRDMYPQYAVHVANILTDLQQALVAVVLNLTYTPDRVTLYAWSSIRESWFPWILPTSKPSLLPSACEDEMYTQMVQHFITCLKHVMEDCPDTTEHLLLEIWSWAVETYCANDKSTQESRIQTSALLGALVQLSWRPQWFRYTCLPAALKISKTTDREIVSWVSDTLKHTAAQTWLSQVPEYHVPSTLGALFELFTSRNMQFSDELLSECCGVPWTRLPTAALDQLLEHFYYQHHDPAMPYHDLPQFSIVLHASYLAFHPNTPPDIFTNDISHEKRHRSVSQYIRAVVSPPLQSHLRGHVKKLLAVITDLAPHIQSAKGQLEDVISRAMVIMCMEPAANIVLPVFLEWVSSCSEVICVASMSSVLSITVFDYFLPIADRLAQTHLQKESSGWVELTHRWCEVWWEASACVKRGGAHAAYALLRRDNAPALSAALAALLNTEVNFSDNEEILALWICVASRASLLPGEEEEKRDCRGVARELIDKWATEPKWSILQVVALQSASPTPTPRHRVLCRFAQCVTSPSEATIRSYEAAVTAALGSNPGDVITWHRTPTLKKLVQLAIKLYPNRELYFRQELEMAER